VRKRAVLPVVLALVLSSACAARYVTSPPVSASEHPLPAQSLTRFAILVSIDGLRPDAIEAFGATTLQRLIREGSYTLAASTITPSKTLPSHTSMLTGQPPERHNVLWNTAVTAKADVIELPNVFSVARSNG
jgi:hypothetical protein